MSMLNNTNIETQFSGDPTGAAAIFAGRGPDADNGTVVIRLNKLLEGEICAAENYSNLIGHAAANPDNYKLEVLEELKAEHAENGNLLRARITELGGEPSTTSGSWGVWSHAVHGTINLFGGDMGSIWALHEGEENALIDYATAIDEVDTVTAHLIVDRIVPSQQKHLAVLDQILNVAA